MLLGYATLDWGLIVVAQMAGGALKQEGRRHRWGLRDIVHQILLIGVQRMKDVERWDVKQFLLSHLLVLDDNELDGGFEREKGTNI
jgi:hypothetical protein